MICVSIPESYLIPFILIVIGVASPFVIIGINEFLIEIGVKQNHYKTPDEEKE